MLPLRSRIILAISLPLWMIYQMVYVAQPALHTGICVAYSYLHVVPTLRTHSKYPGLRSRISYLLRIKKYALVGLGNIIMVARFRRDKVWRSVVTLREYGRNF